MVGVFVYYFSVGAPIFKMAVPPSPRHCDYYRDAKETHPVGRVRHPHPIKEGLEEALPNSCEFILASFCAMER